MRQDGDRIDREHQLQGGPVNTTFGEGPLRRQDCVTDLDPLASGVVLGVAVPLQAGDVVSAITFVSGATALDTPTHWLFALYDPSDNLVGQSADQVDAAWAANTAKKLALATPVVVPRAGVYTAALVAAAADLPSLAGATLANAVVAGTLGIGAKPLARTFGTGVGATAPAAIATPTTVKHVPYVALT